MAKRHATKEKEEAKVDMTPMLDVTFILLIFFIVTMSFVKPPGVDVNKPKAVTTQALAQGNILVGVTAKDEIWMNKHKINVGDISYRVRKALSSTPKGSVVVIADQGANTSTVVKAMDQARLGGATKVWIATRAEKD